MSAEIAFIDDNIDCLEIVKFGFSEVGYEIDTFNDPIHFYNSNKPYKVIISDFHMPNLDGQELLKLIKNKLPDAKTIIYSAYLDGIRNYNLEVDSFLDKPIDFESLLKVVKILLYEYNKNIA